MKFGPAEGAFARVLGVLAIVTVVFGSTSASMVATWSSSGTYSHGYFIVPAFLWLAWGRRRMLAQLPVRPSWWAVPIVAAVGFAWLIGHWMALALPSQLALVAMVPAAIAGTLGVAWVRALAFPLAFLFFAVPIGESLVPVLMNWTADFTVSALRLSGVPVYRDGLHFDIPSGKWSVVDSCSGIRYLFACLALASLYSWTIYRGTARRLMFIACAALIAIVGNWVRAYGIVMLGHLSSNQIATGADHLVYGGLFFAVIMALVFALGAVWREKPPTTAAGRPPHESPSPRPITTAPRHLAAGIASVAALLAWPIATLGSADPSHRPSVDALDVQSHGGWVSSEKPLWSWRPVLKNPASVRSRSFEMGPHAVGMHIGLFGRSSSDSKLTSALNRLIEPDGLNPRWKLAQQGTASARWGGDELDVRSAVLVGSEARLLVWQWYWVDGTATADPLSAALLQLRARWRGRDETSAWIAVYTPDSGEPHRASRVLGEFLDAMSTSIESSLKRSASVAALTPP